MRTQISTVRRVCMLILTTVWYACCAALMLPYLGSSCGMQAG